LLRNGNTNAGLSWTPVSTIIAMSDQYPDRERLTRHVIELAELSRRGEWGGE
jgi:hypothetical protein